MKRILGRTAWGLAVALLLFTALCGTISAALGNPKPAFFGNVVAEVPVPGRIAVFGDSQKGLATFSLLLEQAKREGVEFAVHTGDLVSHCDEPHYRLAKSRIHNSAINVPFLVAPGNHDLKGEPELFNRHVGPRDLVVPGTVNLVILDNGLGAPDVAKVEAKLKELRGPILVFMHVPPFDGAVRPGYEPFLEMIARHPVRYVLSGHVHKYDRLERNGIIHIINGVGGDSDSWQYDQKGYLTILELTGNRITDRTVTVDPEVGVWVNLQHLAVGHVMPFAGSIPGILGILILLAATVYGVRKFVMITQVIVPQDNASQSP